MVGKLQKWGNSLALRIPKSMADDLNLGENAKVTVIVENGSIVVSPNRRKRYELVTYLPSWRRCRFSRSAMLRW